MSSPKEDVSSGEVSGGESRTEPGHISHDDSAQNGSTHIETSANNSVSQDDGTSPQPVSSSLLKTVSFSVNEGTSNTQILLLADHPVTKEDNNKKTETGTGISKETSERLRQLATDRQAANQISNIKVTEVDSVPAMPQILPKAGSEAVMEFNQIPSTEEGILPSANAERNVTTTLTAVGSSGNAEPATSQNIPPVLTKTVIQSILPPALPQNSKVEGPKLMEIQISSTAESMKPQLSSPTFIGPKLSISLDNNDIKKGIKRKDMEEEDSFLQAQPLPPGIVPILTPAQMETSRVKLLSANKIVPPRKRVHETSATDMSRNSEENGGVGKGKVFIAHDNNIRKKIVGTTLQGTPPPPPPPQPRDLLPPNITATDALLHPTYANKKARISPAGRPTTLTPVSAVQLSSLGTVNLSSLSHLSGLVTGSLTSSLPTISLSQGALKTSVSSLTSPMPLQQLSSKNLGQVIINPDPIIVVPHDSVASLTSPNVHHKSGGVPMPLVGGPLTTISLQKSSSSYMGTNTADSGFGNTIISLPATPTSGSLISPISGPMSLTSPIGGLSRRRSYSPVSSDTSSDSENLPSMVGAASPVHVITPENEDRKPYIDAMGRATDAHNLGIESHYADDIGHQTSRKTLMLGSPGVPSTSPGKMDKSFGLYEPDLLSEQNPEMEIQQFVDQYQLMKPGGDRREVPVKKLRRFIPLLIMHLYGMKYAEQVRKVKGLWEKPPSDWPMELPFCDPNNAPRDHRGIRSGKPKKETLNKMFYYLLHRYMEQQKNANSNDPKDQNAPCFADSMPSSLERYKSNPMNNTVAEELRKYRVPGHGSGRPIQETGEALPISSSAFGQNIMRLQNSMPNMNVPVSTPVQETKSSFGPLPGTSNDHTAQSPNNPLPTGQNRTFVLLHSDKTNTHIPVSTGLIRQHSTLPLEISQEKVSQPMPLLHHSLVSPTSGHKVPLVSRASMGIMEQGKRTSIQHVLSRTESNLSAQNPTLTRTLANPHSGTPTSESYVATSQGLRMLPDVNALLSKSVPSLNCALPLHMDRSNDTGQGENSQDGSRKLEAIEGILMLTQSKPPTTIHPPHVPVAEHRSSVMETAKVPMVAHQSSVSQTSEEGDHPQPLALVARLLQMDSATPTPPMEQASEDDKWEVVRCVLERVDEKIERLRKNKQLQDKLLGMLLLARDCLRTMQLNHKTEDFGYTLEKSHELECTAELAIVNNHIPGNHALKWHEFSVAHGQHSPLITKLSGGINGIVGYCLEETTPIPFAKCVNDKLDKYDDVFPYEKPMVWEVTGKLETAEDINKYFADLKVDVPDYNSATVVDVNVLNIQLREPSPTQDLDVPIQECGENDKNIEDDQENSDQEEIQTTSPCHKGSDEGIDCSLNTAETFDTLDMQSKVNFVDSDEKVTLLEGNGGGEGEELDGDSYLPCSSQDMSKNSNYKTCIVKHPDSIESNGEGKSLLDRAMDNMSEINPEWLKLLKVNLINDDVNFQSDLNAQETDCTTIPLSCTEGARQHIGPRDDLGQEKQLSDTDLMLSLPTDIGDELNDCQDWLSVLGMNFQFPCDQESDVTSDDSVTDVTTRMAAVIVNDHALKVDHPYASVEKEPETITTGEMTNKKSQQSLLKTAKDIKADKKDIEEGLSKNSTSSTSAVFKVPELPAPRDSRLSHHTLGERRFVLPSTIKSPTNKLNNRVDALPFPQQETCPQVTGDENCVILGYEPSPTSSHQFQAGKSSRPVCDKVRLGSWKPAFIKMLCKDRVDDTSGGESLSIPLVESPQKIVVLKQSAQDTRSAGVRGESNPVQCTFANTDHSNSVQMPFNTVRDPVPDVEQCSQHEILIVDENHASLPTINLHSTDGGFLKPNSSLLVPSSDGNWSGKKLLQNIAKTRIPKTPAKCRRTGGGASQNRPLLPKIEANSRKKDADMACSIGALISGMGHSLTPQLVGDITHLVRHLYTK